MKATMHDMRKVKIAEKLRDAENYLTDASRLIESECDYRLPETKALDAMRAAIDKLHTAARLANDDYAEAAQSDEDLDQLYYSGLACPYPSTYPPGGHGQTKE